MSPMRKRDHLRQFFDSMMDKFRRSRASKAQDVTAPWEPWELDPAFFTALSQWTLDNANDSLDRFLERAILVIDTGKEFIEMVPDGPIPIRGFLKALAHLLKLGATVGRAQREVQRFAKEVVHWVDSIKTAFQSEKQNHTMLKLNRAYLKETRILIDEICKWATARLEDKRWSTTQGLTVDKEIDDFKSRIAAARSLFMDVAVITIAQTQGSVLLQVQSLIATIQEIQLSQTNILEFLREQEKEAARQKFLAKMLSSHSAEKTAYDEQGKRPCDDETRVAILEDITNWVFDISESTQRFLWLTGDPGSGKSAITASIARECKNKGVLWAQFFINRNLVGTTDPASYFPSIARQLADHSPVVALAVFEALKAQPSLIDDISQDQAGKLFVDSLKVASSTQPSTPLVVIIDGLDETVTSRLESTAEIFAGALLDLPSNVKVFISSRTENEIRRPFTAAFANRQDRVKHVHLDTESSIQDVSRFLNKGIATIARRYHLDVLDWPGETRLEALCKRAAGLFIWAVTVIGFIEEEAKALGKDVLDTILDTLTADDLDDIHALYGTILRIVFNRRKDAWEFDMFRQVVGCLVVLREPLCIADIASLINLRNPKSDKHVDIVHFVTRLRTVLVAGAGNITPQTIPRLHKSFFEYITSESADQPPGQGPVLPLRVVTGKANCEIAIRCILAIADSDNYGALNRTAPIQPTSPTSPSPSRLVSHQPETDDIQSESSLGPLHYAYRHVLSHLSENQEIEAGTLLQGKLSLQELEEKMQLRTSDISQQSHKGMINCVAISPHGRYIASASDDNTILLWDSCGGGPIRPPLTAHSEQVWSVAFSPDGKQLVSGSGDKTLCLWDVESGQQIGNHWIGHSAAVNSVAFSTDGQRVVSGSDDKSVYIWRSKSGGQPDHSPLKGHNHLVRGVAISSIPSQPEADYVISGSYDKTIRLWRATTQHITFIRAYTGHTGHIMSVKFAPTTASTEPLQFISTSWDGTFRLWNVESEGCIRLFQGHTDWVYSVTFTSNSEYIISGSGDKTMRIWKARTNAMVEKPMHVFHTDRPVRSVASHQNLVISSGFKSIQRWSQDMARSNVTSLYPLHDAGSDTLVAAALSSDGKRIATAFSNNNILLSLKGEDAYTYVPVKAPFVDHDGATSRAVLTFSPDGRTLAVLYMSISVHLYRTDTGKHVTSYTLPKLKGRPAPLSLSFSSDGKHLTAFGIDGSHQVWDASDGKPLEDGGDDPVGMIEKDVQLGETQFISRSMSNPDFGVWAYIEGKLRRWDRNGVVTVMIVDTESDLLTRSGAGGPATPTLW